MSIYLLRFFSRRLILQKIEELHKKHSQHNQTGTEMRVLT
jgi:hypothetical protein